MSRCFPYAPPAHLRDAAPGDAVNEPFKIKLRKEKNENVIPEHRTERKREKEDRRKERKLSKEGGKVEDVSFEGNNKRKEVNDESSGITEEHGEPVYSQQSPCYLSDGSRSHKKRKLDQIVSSGGGGSTIGSGLEGGERSSGNILRIRLPLRKHKEPDVLSTSGSAIPADSICQQNVVFFGHTQQKASCSVHYFGKNGSSASITLSEPKSKTHAPLLDERSQSNLTKKEKKTHKVDSLYKSLTEDWNWNISTSQFEPIEDQEWLFASKTQEKSRSLKSCQDMPCGLTSNLWPKATYVVEVDVYALPYAIPF